MKIVLVTSGQPSLNPRLVKEADALSKAGYDVIVLYTYWNDWGTRFDVPLLKSKIWKAKRIGGDPKQKPFTYFLSKLMHKLFIIAAKKLGVEYFSDFAISRNTYWLTKETLALHADLFIAHNLGALPAVVKAAKLKQIPCGFDAEDFHRNEVSNDPLNFDVILKAYIEDKYIPQTDYLTVSSPGIGKAYEELFPAKKPVILLNVFNRTPGINISRKPDSPIKLFWFSQTIGTNRGIEDIIEALNNSISDTFELHLLGKLQHSTSKEYFKNKVLSKLYTLHFHDPVAPDELITFSSQFDIGLALEPAFSINNDTALSNKIFTYMQAGLAIIASKTTAQIDLLNTYPKIGKLYQIGNSNSLSQVLLHYAEHTEDLLDARKASLTLAQTSLNWETEQLKFLKIVKQTLTTTS